MFNPHYPHWLHVAHSIGYAEWHHQPIWLTSGRLPFTEDLETVYYNAKGGRVYPHEGMEWLPWMQLEYYEGEKEEEKERNRMEWCMRVVKKRRDDSLMFV